MPGSSDHGISQARILEQVAIFLFQGLLRGLGIEPKSLASPALQADSLPLAPPGSVSGLGRSPGKGNGNPLSILYAWKIAQIAEPGLCCLWDRTT